ncbi:hypothetical protein DM01DRAFT_1324507 [Hesseltinella vesiculosa]|uniref:Fe2OG dioxygenase domain-containing protein n=1 Tax=Hesseltinella vesiculosa TaxID=101127 RepID=A0A1X2GDM4_9FUNG|nr:hypothetical protein DM01DRAFT_1324507 [Hesseltinella vesiculosa]
MGNPPDVELPFGPPPPHLKSKRQIRFWQRQQEESQAKRQKKIDQDPFRYVERCFKARAIPPSAMAKVVHTTQLLDDSHCSDVIVPVTLAIDLRQHCSALFGPPDTQWTPRARKAYLIKTIPGLIIIPNPFTESAQRHMIKHCLTDFAEPPNVSSLDGHYERPAKGVWDLYERHCQGQLTSDDPDYYTVPVKSNQAPVPTMYQDDTHNHTHKTSDAAAKRLSPTDLLRKQRWITLGYQYNWQTKEYDLEHGLPMPDLLDQLSKTIVSAVQGVGLADGWRNDYPGDQFKAEAGVINYYQLRDALMAHVDKSEVNMEAPLVSASFGHACIYLIGRTTKETEPIPLCLSSGDVIVMTGQSRKAYHGVPRILEQTLPSFLDSQHWPLYGGYMDQARINLNVRQVFNK